MDRSGAASITTGLPAAAPALDSALRSVDRIVWAVAGLCLLAFALNVWGAASFVHDDAYIGFRYALNLSETGDFSWNPGDRVEGYTNFLDLLLIAGLMKLGADPLTAARCLHGLACLAMAAAAAAAAGRLATPENRTRAQLIALSSLLATGGVPLWLWGGLETLLAAAFITIGVAIVAPAFRSGEDASPLRFGLAGAAFALAILTRPDCAVAGAATGACLLAFAPMPVRRRLIAACWLAAVPAAVAAAHTLFRISYYGDALPNTYWAKSGAPDDIVLANGVRYLAGQAIHVLPVWAFLACLPATRKAKGYRRVTALLAVILSCQIAYVISAGGDHMTGGRFLLPVAGPVAIGWGVLAARTGGRGATLLAALLAAAAIAGATYRIANWRPIDPAASVGAATGEFIGKTWPEGSLIALHTAGSTPWFAPANVYIDMLGLNDRALSRIEPEAADIRAAPMSMPGHMRGDANHVLDREPDYIIAGPAEGAPVDAPWFVADLQFARSAAFSKCYAVRKAPIRPVEVPGGRTVDTFTWYERICPRTAPDSPPR